MITGAKDEGVVSVADAISCSRLPLALAIVVLLAGALALVVSAAPEATIALY
jgi:hypothetical protein